MWRLICGSGSIVSTITVGVLLAASMSVKFDLSKAPTEAWATDSAQREALDEGGVPDIPQGIPDSLEGNPEAIALGKRTFHTYCWGCHGRNGTGAQCPDFSDNEQIHGDRYEDLVKVVTNGVKGTPMGPWGYALGRKRILQVVAYVYSLKGTRAARQE